MQAHQTASRRPAIFGFEARDIFLFALTIFVAFWTARAALVRGKNPWVWGIAALVLGLMPFDQLRLLGVAPVLYLMFFVRPVGPRPRQVERNACTRCASPHSLGQNFCTKCGWDLSKEYSPEGGDTVLASEMHQPKPSSTATMERPAEPSADTNVMDAPGQPETPPEPSAEPAAAVPQHATQSETSAADGDAPAAGEARDTAPEPEPEPLRDPGACPSPARRLPLKS